MPRIEPSPDGLRPEYADRQLLVGPAPWATLPPDRRRPIRLDAVLDALAAADQLGPGPEAAAGFDGDRLGPWRSLLPEGMSATTARPAAVLVALFEEDGETRVVLTRRSE